MPGMSTLEYVLDKFNLDYKDGNKLPVEIPNFGRDNLAELFAELGFKSGVEIGVERGLYTEVLCKSNPQATIYAVDPWEVYKDYRLYVSQRKLDKFYAETMQRISHYKNGVLIKGFSEDVVKDFDDNSLDFVYIDGNHDFQHMSHDLFAWSKKIKVGGIISGHDYVKNKRLVTNTHVVYVVQSFVQSYRIKPWFLLGTKDEVPGIIRDSSRSYMWVKPKWA